ncbi:epoxide hydrolase 4-like protein [Leptotrombidium deliense]|uniref:Epoxide hydrolase 4-like protein n=1 Tax=Leptotrombidium deliense TaxID=299467 RepID=A0A443SAV4_9ACAR|nr:epoxide hydrolase 4-like protein [Leptotrombidium deliense]
MSIVSDSPFVTVSALNNFVTSRVQRAKNLLRKLFFLSISLFYGWIVSLIIFVQVLRYRSSFFLVKKREKVPKCLTDETLGKHEFISLKDIRLHYVANGNPENPMMILLHGFPEFWFSWRHQLKAFSDDYYVVAVDLRGYGDSEKPAGKQNYTTSKICADIEQFITALGRKKVVVVGHDWGGAIAWRFASSYPEMVLKLIILNAPHPTNFSEVLLSDLKQFLMSWYMFFFQLPLLPELLFISRDFNLLTSLFSQIATDEEIEAYKYSFSKPGAITCPINYYRANIGSSNFSNKKCIIESPTLVIWGENDTALSLQLASGAAKYVNNSFTVRMIENGSHFIQIHKPEIVNKHMRDFLN